MPQQHNKTFYFKVYIYFNFFFEIHLPQTTTAIRVYVKISTANGMMNCSDIRTSE